MYAVIKNADKTTLKETYKLKSDTDKLNICDPIESFVVSDTFNIEPIVILEHDQKQMTAKEMNELILLGALCFDTPDEFKNWKDKNGIVSFDETGNPIIIKEKK